jgi:hypothetical protein
MCVQGGDDTVAVRFPPGACDLKSVSRIGCEAETYWVLTPSGCKMHHLELLVRDKQPVYGKQCSDDSESNRKRAIYGDYLG